MNWSSNINIWDAASARRVLVVDDDDAMARMIRLTLVSEGYEVTTASDGIQGLEKLEQQGFALVILDLQMPNMDGRQMYTEMKRRGINIPVLIVSAYGAEAAREELQADAAVRKPFDTAVLLEKIQSLLA
jgi:two-component system, response regulator, stage 0 sporulation protein F